MSILKNKMKSNTIQKIIFSVLIIVAILVFNIFVMITANNQIDKIVEVRKEIITESATATNLSDTKRKIEELKVVDSRLNNILIEKGKIVNFISLIEETSNDLGVDIQIFEVDFNDSSDDKVKVLGELEMDFQILGSWQQITTFLQRVESLPYVINIESLRFSINNSPDSIGWNANFTLKGVTN